MILRYLLILVTAILCHSCYQAERDCASFKNGTFEFTTMIDDEKLTTRFIRQGDREIDYFRGKSDTSEVRWINQCEYIVKKLNPKNISEEQAIHIKILSTTANSYTFEYGLVGSTSKSKGTAIKIQ